VEQSDLHSKRDERIRLTPGPAKRAFVDICGVRAQIDDMFKFPRRGRFNFNDLIGSVLVDIKLWVTRPYVVVHGIELSKTFLALVCRIRNILLEVLLDLIAILLMDGPVVLRLFVMDRSHVGVKVFLGVGNRSGVIFFNLLSIHFMRIWKSRDAVNVPKSYQVDNVSGLGMHGQPKNPKDNDR